MIPPFWVSKDPRLLQSRNSAIAALLLDLARINLHHGPEKFERLGLGPLEGVPSDDGSETAAVADGAGFVEDVFVRRLGAAGENDDAPAVEGALDDVPDAILERCSIGTFAAS